VRGHDEAGNAKTRSCIHPEHEEKVRHPHGGHPRLTFGAAACGVQEGEEEVEKARQVEKQLEKKQQELEEKLQEGQ
jgi:hypothetical protein